MKKTRLLATIMIPVILMTLFILPTSATESPHTHIEIIFEDENLSDEFKEKATAYLLNGDEDDGSCTYGIICQALGHDLESTTTYTISHKARTTAPRCLKRNYLYSACTRCSYETSTLKSSVYIYCCS